MDGDSKERALEAGAAVFSTVVGTAVGGVAGALAGAALTPMVVPLMTKVWDEVTGDSQASAGGVLLEASSHAGLDPEEMVREICRDEHRRLLGSLAFSSGARTRNAAKICALGQALADGVISSDDARLDEVQLVVRALDDLEAPHIAVLDLLAAYVPGTPPHLYADVDKTVDGAPTRRWTVGQLADARPGLRNGLTGLLGTLQHHGLAKEDLNMLRVLEELTRAQERESRNGRPVSAYRRNGSALPNGMPRVLPEWYATALGENAHQYLAAAGRDPSSSVPDGSNAKGGSE